MNTTEKALVVAIAITLTTVAFAQTYIAGVHRGVLEAGNILIDKNMRRGR